MKKIIFILTAIVYFTGCSACSVQIWANSDSKDPRMYTRKNPHYVHVQEPMDFRILVIPDNADYVLMNIGSQLFMPQKVNAGEYALARLFDSSCRDMDFLIEAKAYRQNANPDYRNENGILRKTSDTIDQPDTLLASTFMHVSCYQSKILLNLRLPGTSEPDCQKQPWKFSPATTVHA